MEAVVQVSEIPPLRRSLDDAAANGLRGFALSYLRDFNMAAFWAGIAGFIWYTFGAVPLHLAVSGQLGLTAAQSSSWMCIVWLSGAVRMVEADWPSRHREILTSPRTCGFSDQRSATAPETWGEAMLVPDENP